MQVDAGDYFQVKGVGREAVNRLMLESLREFPVDIFHLGFGDLSEWKELRGAAGLPTRILSTNLRTLSEEDGQPESYAVISIEGSRLGMLRPLRIGFLGLTIPQRVKARSGFQALDPRQALAGWKAEAVGLADFWILLSDLPRDGQTFQAGDLIHQLADEYPEIRAVLLAEKRFILYEPERIGETLVLSSVDRRRYLTWLEIRLDQRGQVVELSGQSLQLGADVVEDPDWKTKQDALGMVLR